MTMTDKSVSSSEAIHALENAIYKCNNDMITPYDVCCYLMNQIANSASPDYQMKTGLKFTVSLDSSSACNSIYDFIEHISVTGRIQKLNYYCSQIFSIQKGSNYKSDLNLSICPAARKKYIMTNPYILRELQQYSSKVSHLTSQIINHQHDLFFKSNQPLTSQQLKKLLQKLLKNIKYNSTIDQKINHLKLQKKNI